MSRDVHECIKVRVWRRLREPTAKGVEKGCNCAYDEHADIGDVHMLTGASRCVSLDVGRVAASCKL